MRFLFFLLLLANVAFLAYAQFGPGAPAGGEAQIVGQQLNPEKVRLLAPEQVNALTRKPDLPKPVAACLEWGALGAADAARAAQALEALGPGVKLSQRKQDDAAGFWVYIGPLATRQLATQKAAELKRLGVDDYFILPDDPKWRNTVSLGVFKTEDAAKARLAALRTKGVRSAIVGARETIQGKTWFQVREPLAAVAAKLNELKAAFAGTEVRDCTVDEKNG